MKIKMLIISLCLFVNSIFANTYKLNEEMCDKAMEALLTGMGAILVTDYENAKGITEDVALKYIHNVANNLLKQKNYINASRLLNILIKKKSDVAVEIVMHGYYNVGEEIKQGFKGKNEYEKRIYYNGKQQELNQYNNDFVLYLEYNCYYGEND